MSGFSNSLYLILQHPCHPNLIFQFIHSATSQVSRFISSLDHQYQSIKHTIFAVLQHDGQTAEKVCLTYPPIYCYGATPSPSNLHWTQIPDFRTRNPGLTFPKPENPGLQKKPGFGNSSQCVCLCLSVYASIGSQTSDQVIIGFLQFQTQWVTTAPLPRLAVKPLTIGLSSCHTLSPPVPYLSW